MSWIQKFKLNKINLFVYTISQIIYNNKNQYNILFQKLI